MAAQAWNCRRAWIYCTREETSPSPDKTSRGLFHSSSMRFNSKKLRNTFSNGSSSLDLLLSLINFDQIISSSIPLTTLARAMHSKLLLRHLTLLLVFLFIIIFFHILCIKHFLLRLYFLDCARVI